MKERGQVAKAIPFTALSIALLLSGMSAGATQSYILPGSRKALITAFSGTLFKTVNKTVTTVSDWFNQRGYKTDLLIRDTWNPATPQQDSNNPGYYTILDFENKLVGGNYGVIFADGHAGNAGIAVEHFDTFVDMQRRFQYLTQVSMQYSPVDMHRRAWWRPGKGECLGRWEGSVPAWG